MKANTPMTMKPSFTTNLLLMALSALMLLVATSSAALAESGDLDWRQQDVKGKMVDTSKHRGKVTLVFINGPETRDKMKPISKKLTLKYGHNKKVDQLTVVDLREAPMTWKAAEKVNDEVTKRTSGAHDRMVKRMNGWLKADGQKTIPGLTRKLHIVLDWEGEIVKKYKHWDTNKFITVVVLNQQGDPIGSFKGNQLDKVFEAVEATLAQAE